MNHRELIEHYEKKIEDRKRAEEQRHREYERRQSYRSMEEAQRSLEKSWPVLLLAFFGMPIGCIVVGSAAKMLWLGIPMAVLVVVVLGWCIVSLVREASGANLKDNTNT